MRLEARADVSRVMLVAAPFAAVAFTLLLSSLFVAWAGAPLSRTYALIFEGGFGSRFADERGRLTRRWKGATFFAR